MLKPSSDTVQLQPGITLLWSMMCKKRNCEKSCWGLPSPFLQTLLKLSPELSCSYAWLWQCILLIWTLIPCIDLGLASAPSTYLATTGLLADTTTVTGPAPLFLFRCSALCQQVHRPCQLCCHPCLLLVGQPSLTAPWQIPLFSRASVGTSYVSTFQDSCFLFRKARLVLADILT